MLFRSYFVVDGADNHEVSLKWLEHQWLAALPYHLSVRCRGPPAMVVAEEPELREADFVFKTTVPNGAPKSLEDMEKAHILRVLEQCGWNQTHAAEILDIDRVTLHHKLKRYGWSKPLVETR